MENEQSFLSQNVPATEGHCDTTPFFLWWW